MAYDGPYCDGCGKRLYGTRKAAHAAMAIASNTVRIYNCPETPWQFHVTSERKTHLRKH